VPAAPLRILVTGFGGFPGSPRNPTAQLIAGLARDRPRFARLGIHIEVAMLPVIYAQTGPRLAALTEKFRPDAILHFGVAPRRTKLSVETRALNRVSLLHPDASGARASRRAVAPGAPPHLKSTLPSSLIAAALRRAGFDAAVSNDAGDYVCNQTLFLSLCGTVAPSPSSAERLAPRTHAPLVGFIHVPPLAIHGRPSAGRRGLSLAAATRAAAAAVLACAPKLRQGCADASPGARFA
jgi:pyroglutamyl-peptidase